MTQKRNQCLTLSWLTSDEDLLPIENDFLKKATLAIEENIANEQFGVSELAQGLGMSRSNLLRKVKKLTKLSASQFIRQVRLKKAMEMLRQTALNVSEVSYKVGFSSTSYFIKCFREYYGYPPGEVGKRDPGHSSPVHSVPSGKRRLFTITAGSVMVVLAVALFIFLKPSHSSPAMLEKSIAVLPFKNDSNDSTNQYLINGLMESTLNNLQKIEDLRVISRTSSEKYRNTTKSIPEISRELNVNYFVEGSGQKIGDEILLSIQLIEASSDRHLWSQQYSRKTRDIFKLQREVAKSIAEEIQAIITPEEEELIDRIPTDNLEAYDYYLKGLDQLHEGTDKNLRSAIELFKKAISLDGRFGLAYAHVAIAYYYLDIFKTEKEYLDEINSFADKALLLEPKAAQSLLAKALYYMHNKEYDQVTPYLEKALEYNPNSAGVINMLSDFYANYNPNTAKYLEYALKGVQLDIAAHDSVTASYIYLHLSNALIQTGFVDEAIRYIHKSLAYNPENPFGYVSEYIRFAKHRDLNKLKNGLIKALSKDTARLDILQEVGKVCYMMKDYKEAYKYYKRFIDIRETSHMTIYRHENPKIGFVLSKMGYQEMADKYFEDFKDFAKNDHSIYKHLNMAGYYAYMGDVEKVIEETRIFTEEENYFYWIVLFLEMDPLLEGIATRPEFQELTRTIKTKFWKNHERIKATLKEKGLI